MISSFNSSKYEGFLVELIEKDKKKIETIEKDGISMAEADPFSALFESMVYGISIEDWHKFEGRRLRQKTIQNHIGKLHEVAISCFDGWQMSTSTADVENKDLEIVAEVKNKYNTMNSSSALATYKKLEQLVDGTYEGFTSYLVQVIPKPNVKPYQKPFRPSDSSKKKAKKCHAREDILEIDGQSFYALVNKGDNDTLKLLYQHTAEIWAKHIGKSANKAMNDLMKDEFIDAILPSLR